MPNSISEVLTTAIHQLNSEAALRSTASALLNTLGYHSDKTIKLEDSAPQTFLSFLELNNPNLTLDKEKALFGDWVSADLLFQITNEELSGENTLFRDTEIKPSLLQSYLFFAIELDGTSSVNGSYARGKLTSIARQINRLFPMPVMLLIKHPAQDIKVLSIAVINRRQNKREDHKDVLGKVTIIRDISLTQPHRGHIDILTDLTFSNLKHPEKLPINNFDTLHTAWEEIFNIELLNKRFYKELANWYFWALPQVSFPNDIEEADEKRRATGLIRLLTRLIFCWFIKEKDLIPEKLFHTADLKSILKDFDPNSKTDSHYYQAILQNLFFATLNQRMGKDSKSVPFRQFAADEGFNKNRNTYDVNNLYRYEALFAADMETALTHFADIPFLNGGLFECLDQTEEDTNKKRYIDGFSRNPNKRPYIPNHLFFSDEIKNIDLSETYGDNSRKKESVSGIIRILNRYKFTIVENTPIDQEIALDPELLGKVFENLLASYNEETKTTARKQTGSFYTPRPIVNYMVDESLKAHLHQALNKEGGMSEADATEGLDILFTYTEREHAFSEKEINILLNSIHTCKILDPACGSGAFPMGILQKLVYILGKLDPKNKRWQQRQIDATKWIPDSTAQQAAIKAIEEAFAENENDYGRKLYLIENCLYGVDIQPIAIQISKLRFFISLVCDQKTNKNKKANHGIRPLPNLETKFVAADSLIGLPEMDASLLVDPRVEQIERQIEEHYHSHFSIQRRDQKLALQKKVKKLRHDLADILSESLMAPAKAQHIAEWDPFDSHASSDFFDPFWMFGIYAGQTTHKSGTTLSGELSVISDELTPTEQKNSGFDIVIGNPPYVQIQKFPVKQKSIWQKQGFQTYAPTGDIYCLFYERGAQLLKKGGHLCYITMNRWMRAGYGVKLRQFFSSSVNTTKCLDFGMAQNFSAATTLTCILQLKNEGYSHKSRSCYAADDRAAMLDPKLYFDQNHSVLKLSSEAWVVLSKKRQEIKSLVEKKGVSLKKWDIKINYGVKTGYNDAFYIDQTICDRLISEDPESANFIVPLLRGRNLKRYGHTWDNEYMISTFPALNLKSEELPRPIHDHLAAYLPKLKQTGETYIDDQGHKAKTRKKNENEWFETQDSINYYKEFQKPKIIYPEITKNLGFYYDTKEHFIPNNKGFVINSETESLPYLTAVFNSYLFRCAFKDNFPELMGNTYEVRKIFIEKIPIKKPTTSQSDLFFKLVPLIQLANAEKQTGAYQFLESLIDACVMECYFHDHMAERNLLFIDELIPHLISYDPEADQPAQLAFLEPLYKTLNKPESSIRNKLLRISTDSPDLLAVIRQEGQV